MKAIVQGEYGSADVLVLDDIDKPTVGADEVLIKVEAASVFIGDWHMMTGLPYMIRFVGFGVRAPKDRVRGQDVAGRVEAVGRDVIEFRPGDEVFGHGSGAFAEYATAEADTLATKPSNLTFEQAATVPNSGSAALQALRDVGKIQSGQEALIIGAAGGIGSFAVQIAKSYGARVTGVCSTRQLDLVRSLGADATIDYTREDFAEQGKRYDLILDMAGRRSLSELRKALAPRGTLVIVGGEGGGRFLGGFDRQIRARILSLFVGQKLTMLASKPNAERLQALRELIEAGKVMPVVSKSYPLVEVPDAIRDLEKGHAQGKVVIEV